MRKIAKTIGKAKKVATAKKTVTTKKVVAKKAPAKKPVKKVVAKKAAVKSAVKKPVAKKAPATKTIALQVTGRIKRTASTNKVVLEPINDAINALPVATTNWSYSSGSFIAPNMPAIVGEQNPVVAPASPTGDFEPDAFVIRTSDKNRIAYNNFEWKREIGAVIECPDWKPTPSCGNGLHGCLDGVGNWSLLSSDHDAIWWIIGVKRDECIELGGKVKFPRGKVVYFGKINGALCEIAKQWRRIGMEALELAKKNATTGSYGHAATTGSYAHAATTGESAHAATTGSYAHAATTGKNSIAASFGYLSKAKAGKGGAIVVVKYDYNHNIVAIRASKVGENGIKPDTFYILGADYTFLEVAE